MHKIGQASKLSAYIPVPLRVTMMMANALSQMYKFPWPFILGNETSYSICET